MTSAKPKYALLTPLRNILSSCEAIQNGTAYRRYAGLLSTYYVQQIVPNAPADFAETLSQQDVALSASAARSEKHSGFSVAIWRGTGQLFTPLLLSNQTDQVDQKPSLGAMNAAGVCQQYLTSFVPSAP